MINFAKDIKPISYIKANTAKTIRAVNDNKSPVIVTQNGEAKAVILDVESYQNLIDAVNLMKIISIGEQDIKTRNVLSHQEVKNQVSRILD